MALIRLAPRSVAARLEQARRDVDVLLRSFAGVHPSPLVARAPRLSAVEPAFAPAPAAVAGSARQMQIVAIARETADAITLTLAEVRGAAIGFEAGQFMLLRAEVGGESLWRAYSICTAPSDATVAITIKRVLDGRVSNYLHDHAKVGQVLDVRGPSGRFTLEPGERPRHLVMLAGGSGITPLMSHIRNELQNVVNTRITLIYGTRRAADIIFGDALSTLERSYANRLRVRHVLDETSAGAFGQGPLDDAALARELSELALSEQEETKYLVCGPEPMRLACRNVLARRGVPDTQVLEERFFGIATPSDSATFQAQDLVLKVAGAERTTRVQAGETILQAAMREQVALNFSCTMGGCGACMAVLVEGTVHMAEPNCLTKREREEGKILPCIAQPRSACRVEPLP
jgi:ferredoxin-NADP reductase